MIIALVLRKGGGMDIIVAKEIGSFKYLLAQGSIHRIGG